MVNYYGEQSDLVQQQRWKKREQKKRQEPWRTTYSYPVVDEEAEEYRVERSRQQPSPVVTPQIEIAPPSEPEVSESVSQESLPDVQPDIQENELSPSFSPSRILYTPEQTRGLVNSLALDKPTPSQLFKQRGPRWPEKNDREQLQKWAKSYDRQFGVRGDHGTKANPGEREDRTTWDVEQLAKTKYGAAPTNQELRAFRGREVNTALSVTQEKYPDYQPTNVERYPQARRMNQRLKWILVGTKEEEVEIQVSRWQQQHARHHQLRRVI